MTLKSYRGLCTILQYTSSPLILSNLLNSRDLRSVRHWGPVFIPPPRKNERSLLDVVGRGVLGVLLFLPVLCPPLSTLLGDTPCNSPPLAHILCASHVPLVDTSETPGTITGRSHRHEKRSSPNRM